MSDDYAPPRELLRDILLRIDRKTDEAATNALLAKQAAELLAAKVDDHIAQDRKMHEQIDERISPLEHFRTRIGSYVAVMGAGVSLIVGTARDALWPH